MLKTTKKMREDIKRLREDDLVVCDLCGSDEISEKVWVYSNSYIVVDGHLYFKYMDGVDDEQYWCYDCSDMARPIHVSEYKEKKDAKQKS